MKFEDIKIDYPGSDHADRPLMRARLQFTSQMPIPKELAGSPQACAVVERAIRFEIAHMIYGQVRHDAEIVRRALAELDYDPANDMELLRIKSLLEPLLRAGHDLIEEEEPTAAAPDADRHSLF